MNTLLVAILSFLAAGIVFFFLMSLRHRMRRHMTEIRRAERALEAARKVGRRAAKQHRYMAVTGVRPTVSEFS